MPIRALWTLAAVAKASLRRDSPKKVAVDKNESDSHASEHPSLPRQDYFTSPTPYPPDGVVVPDGFGG
jgi:hypothetical protein